MEKYDQSVTCLADNQKTLEICSNKLRTPENLAQTDNSIDKQSINRNKEKLRKDPNKTQNKQTTKLNRK